MFPDEDPAKAWLAALRWPDGPDCPHCGSVNVQSNIKHKSMTHRCRECPNKRMFSVKTGTVMESSNLTYRVWVVGTDLFTTNIKGISSMRRPESRLVHAASSAQDIRSRGRAFRRPR